MDVSDANASAAARATALSPTDASTLTQVSTRPLGSVLTCRRSIIQPQPNSSEVSGPGTSVGMVTVWMSGASSANLEAGFERQDRPIGLAGHHPPGHERGTVAHPVDLVTDGFVEPTAEDEVGVQRVHGAVIGHGLRRGREALGDDLPAIDPPPLVGRADPDEHIGTVRFESQKLSEVARLGFHHRQARGTQGRR